MFDKDFLDAIMKSAGIGAAIGWAIQFWVWREERNERQSLSKFMMEQLVAVTTEKVAGTASISALTTAVNAVIAVVKGRE